MKTRTHHTPQQWMDADTWDNPTKKATLYISPSHVSSATSSVLLPPHWYRIDECSRVAMSTLRSRTTPSVRSESSDYWPKRVVSFCDNCLRRCPATRVWSRRCPCRETSSRDKRAPRFRETSPERLRMLTAADGPRCHLSDVRVGRSASRAHARVSLHESPNLLLFWDCCDPSEFPQRQPLWIFFMLNHVWNGRTWCIDCWFVAVSASWPLRKCLATFDHSRKVFSLASGIVSVGHRTRSSIFETACRSKLPFCSAWISESWCDTGQYLTVFIFSFA